MPQLPKEGEWCNFKYWRQMLIDQLLICPQHYKNFMHLDSTKRDAKFSLTRRYSVYAHINT
jgi:hypothetical protein